MQNCRILILCFPLLFFISSAALPAGSKNNSGVKPGSGKTQKAGAILVRAVTGSGGGMGMTSTHTLLSATAGETVAGPARSDPWAVSSGFWIPLSDTVGVLPDGEDNLPDVFRLQQNFPNPFNPSTTIEYDLPDRYRVLVEIYNSVGQCIRQLKSEDQGPGRVRLDWDGKDETGKTAETGIYLYRITARPAHAAKADSKIVFQSTKKMLLVK